MLVCHPLFATFGNVLFKSFAHFLIRLFVFLFLFLSLSFETFQYFLDTNPITDMRLASIFFLIVAYLFILSVSFEEPKLLMFKLFGLSTFFFYGSCFCYCI